ncbi:MAG: polysaccharide deacetylase family protein [Bacteroidales bacterium]
MLLIYSPKKNNRLQYIVKFLFQNICGFEYVVTSSSEDFLNFKGAKINYSDRDIPGEHIQIVPCGLLHEKGLRDIQPDIIKKDGLSALFPDTSKNKLCDMGFDIFSMAFYLVTRYEEYLPYIEDKFGRFEADQSISLQRGFLEIPLIDKLTMVLKNKIVSKFPFLNSRERKFEFIPTYDIDVAYAYRGRGISRNTLAISKDLLTFNFTNLSNRMKVLLKKSDDPFDTYELQLNLQKQYQLHPIYFFHVGDYGAYDKNISVHSPLYIHVCKMLGDYAETGVHPSFASHHRKNRLNKEIRRLSEILNREVENSRQHYLKIHFPDTYQDLIKNGIKRDFSMGYATHTGFRAGTCTPFPWYDLTSETETPLLVYPVTVMDASLKSYMNLNIEDSIDKIKKLADEVKSVEGTFVSLWHNDALSNFGIWENWQKVYIEMLTYIKNLQLTDND